MNRYKNIKLYIKNKENCIKTNTEHIIEMKFQIICMNKLRVGENISTLPRKKNLT